MRQDITWINADWRIVGLKALWINLNETEIKNTKHFFQSNVCEKCRLKNIDHFVLASVY